MIKFDRAVPYGYRLTVDGNGGRSGAAGVSPQTGMDINIAQDGSGYLEAQNGAPDQGQINLVRAGPLASASTAHPEGERTQTDCPGGGDIYSFGKVDECGGRVA